MGYILAKIVALEGWRAGKKRFFWHDGGGERGGAGERGGGAAGEAVRAAAG